MLRITPTDSSLRASLLALFLATGLLAPAHSAGLPLQTSRLSQIAVYPEREVAAPTQARNVTTLAAEVNGTLLTWSADVGQRVRRGQVLAQLDTRDLSLAREQAQAQVDNARAQWQLATRQQQRAQELAAKGFLSPEALNQNNTQVEVWRTQLQAAQVQLRLAQRQLDKATVRAPFDAEVIARMAQAGAPIAMGSPLFTLSESGAVQLTAQLSPAQARELRQASDIHWLGAGQRIAVPADALRLTRSLDATTRTQTLRAQLPPDVPAGSNGVLRWRAQQAHIAAQELVRRQGQLGVFVVRDQRARFHPLPQAQEGQQAAAQGLSAETLLVTQGQQRLQDGDAVPSTDAAR